MMRPDLKPPRTVYHGTTSSFDAFDIETRLGAHFGSQQAARDRLRDTGGLKIHYEAFSDDGDWFVLEETWNNKPKFEHGPFADEDAAEAFICQAPKHREPLEFEIDVYRALELPDLGTWEFETMHTHFSRNKDLGLWTAMEDVWREWNISSESGWAAMKAAIKAAGYDCIAYSNETEDPGSISWIVMDANKIHPKWKPEMSARSEAVMRPRMQA